MNELELELQQLMTERAGAVRAIPNARNAVRRARVRRAANAGVATLVVVALAAVGTGAVRSFVRPNEKVEVAGPGAESDYSFTATEGEYPTVATGEFRGSTWELTATAIDDLSVDLMLTIEEGATHITKSVPILATDDSLLIEHVDAAAQLDGAHVVFGATTESVKDVEVNVADGNVAESERIFLPARRFLGYDSQNSIHVDYFIAFVPGDAPGFVHARDALGVDYEVEPYGDVSVAPHVVASGVSGEAAWSVEFASTEEDRFCIVFMAVDIGSQCVTRDQLEAAGPLHLIQFERDNVLGLVGVISGDVSQTILHVDGNDPATLRWFEPPNEELGNWPIRMVAVGLPPGTHGTIEATFGETDNKEIRF